MEARSKPMRVLARHKKSPRVEDKVRRGSHRVSGNFCILGFVSAFLQCAGMGRGRGGNVAAALFLLLLSLSVARETVCAFDVRQSRFAVRALALADALLLWALIFRRRRKLESLLERLAHLQSRTGVRDGVAHRLLVRAAVLANILVTCLCTHFEVSEAHRRYGVWLPDCQTFYATRYMPRVFERHLAMHTLFNFLYRISAWSLTQIVAVFYATFCLQLSRILARLHSQTLSPSDAGRLHGRVLTLVEQFEGVASPLVLAALSQFFADAFGALTDFIHLMREGLMTLFALRTVACAAWTGVLFMSVVFGAEVVGTGLARLRDKMVVEPDRVRTLADLGEALRWADAAQIGERSSILTAWGLFNLDRGVVLAMLTSLVTFGVILAQMHGK